MAGLHLFKRRSALATDGGIKTDRDIPFVLCRGKHKNIKKKSKREPERVREASSE